MKKTCIVSFFMPNIHPVTVEMQAKVVEKYNVSKIPHLRVQCPMPTVDNNGEAVDRFVQMNESDSRLGYENIIVLDIDCIPLSEKTLDYIAQKSSDGYLIGNIQRSNHIMNNEHVFVAPSLIAFNMDIYRKMGSPSFRETPRGDMSEELTYRAEEQNIPIEMIMPLRYDAAPREAPFWPLAKGMPNYGIGTTYGNDEFGEMSWHCFQIRYPGNQQRFFDKCNEVLGVK
jgi:hypothetical protein